MKRFLSLAAFAVLAVLALAACGSSGSSSSSSSTTAFNSADVTFAQSMIPHHQQAVQMAKMAKTNASSPAVKTLADNIEAAQGPEINAMSGWLKAWGKGQSSSGMNGMDMGSMPGIMSEKDMNNLDAAKGATFDRMFLTMMIAHHQGAIEMATAEMSAGKNGDALALAKKIAAAQTAEIATMRGLLKS